MGRGQSSRGSEGGLSERRRSAGKCGQSVRATVNATRRTDRLIVSWHCRAAYAARIRWVRASPPHEGHM